MCSSDLGRLDLYGPKDAEDFYDVVEWAAAQPWSTGKVASSGISWYAMMGWRVAALQPPHLAAIVAWAIYKGRRIASALTGSTPSDIAGGPSMTKLTKRICSAVKGAPPAMPVTDAVRNVRTKKPSSHGSTGVRKSTGRGRTQSLATQKSIASSQAVCVPAIECGAASAYRNRHATVARSSHTGKDEG